MATISLPATKQVLDDSDQVATTSGKGKTADDTTVQGAEEDLEGDGGDKTPKGAAAASTEGQNGSVERANTDADDGRVPTTNLQPTFVPAEPVPKAAQADDTEKDKDKGSLATTLTGTMKDTRRKANQSPTPVNGEKPKVSVSTPSKPKLSSSRSNSSFFSKIIRLLIPCIGPSSRAHPVDVDDRASGSTEPHSSEAHKEKQALKEVERPAKPDSAATSSSPPLKAPDPLAIPPPAAPDAELILPPTPTKRLLPQAETEGVTSGAVQPPGSTGDDIALDHSRAHTRDSGDESEGTSYSEDEDVDDHLDDAEDDEDRLIMNGGAGIPIGPVSPFTFLYLGINWLVN
jgi:carboxy-terminal domain RNA polymerase II polypeptide A small phosphatase